MPISSLPSVTSVTFTATSGVPPNVITHGTQKIDPAGLSLGANSVQVTHPGIVSALSSGNTISHSLQIEHGGLTVVSTAGTPYVPPPPIMLDTNGVTLKYISSSIPSGQSNPYIVESPQGSGTYYAVMSSNNDDSKSKIKAYAANFSQPITNPYVSPFVANGTKIPFNQIVTTLMTDMSNMFYTIGNFNSNISSWDTSSVTNMTSMFNGASRFNNGNNPGIENSGIAGIGYWHTSKVTNMSYMFSSCSLNSNIGSWDVSSVTNMEQMFYGSFFTNGNNNHPSIGSWQTLNVKNMKRMFLYCYYFNRDISTWNVSGLLENPMPLFSQNSRLTNALLPPAFRPPPIANILSGLYTNVETTLNFAISVGSSPFREASALAFDGNIYTKYLNFNGAGSDVLIDATQNYLVTGLGLTTANDGPERDPTSFTLYGSNTPFVITNFVNPNDFWAGGSNFASGGLPGQTLIASGSLSPPLERFTAYPNVTFSNNSTRYRYYRLVFDSIRNLPYTANCVQISEIRLAGYL